jgi:hypothetical protein
MVVLAGNYASWESGLSVSDGAVILGMNIAPSHLLQMGD